MANVTEEGGAPSSNLGSVNNTNVATFTMPASVALDVESVVATINNAAGADTIAQLTIKDQSGQVIATKRQDDTIPAGDTGTATFALRNDNSGGGIRFRKINTGTYLDVRTTDTGARFSSSIYFGAFEDFRVHAGRDIDLDTNGGNDVNVSADNDVNLSAADIINLTALVNVNLDGSSQTNINGGTVVNVTGGGLHVDTTKLGFFGVPTVTQQATPATLGQVIALLQAYGFCP